MMRAFGLFVAAMISAAPLGGCGSHAATAAPHAVGRVIDAATGEPVAAAEVLINGRALVARSDARGQFAAALADGTSAANLTVIAPGYVRAMVPQVATGNAVTVSLQRSAPTTGSGALFPLRAATAARRAGSQTQAQFGDLFGWCPLEAALGAYTSGSGSGGSGGSSGSAASGPPVYPTAPSSLPDNPFFAAFGGTPGNPTCFLASGGPCVCVSGCPLVGSGCGGVTYPVAGMALPPGCQCDPNYCNNVPTDLAVDAAQRNPGTPQPPASLSFSDWSVATAGCTPDTGGDAGVAEFNYIPGCLVFADDPTTQASADPSDIQWDLTTYQARCIDAKDLPFLMYSTLGGGRVAPLQGLVIVDIEAHQDGRRLEVAAGTSCGLVSDLPSQTQQYITPAIGVYSDDPTTGLFAMAGDGNNGWLATSVAAGAVALPIDHLGVWMVASQVGSSGGCVTGQMLNACDGTRPVARHGVRVNVIDTEGTRAWTAQTDQSGNYCADAPVDNYWPGLDTKVPQPFVRYFVSGTDITETAMCDPLPDGTHGTADCRTCQPALQNTSSDPRLCTNCSFTDPLPPVPLPNQFTDTCAPPPKSDPLRHLVLTPCTFCPGAGAATCSLSGQPELPIIGGCTALDTTLGYGPTASGRMCACKWAGSACNYTQDQCCFVAPKDTSVAGWNQGGCKPGAIDPLAGTCGRCTVNVIGGLCDADQDICCDRNNPSNPVVCLDSVCVAVAQTLAQD